MPVEGTQPGANLRRGILLAIPVSAALFLELAADSPSKGSIATGALFCGFAGLWSPPGARAVWQSIAAAVVAATAALGVLTGSPPFLAVLTAAVVGPVVGFGFTISAQLGKAGRPVLAALVISQGLGLDHAEALRAFAYTAVGGCLQVACSLGAYAIGRLEGRSEGHLRWKGPTGAELVARLSPRSTTFRHAVRLGVALAVGVASYQVLNFGEHGFWVPLTIAFVLTPEASETFHRLALRAVGTATGLGVATVLSDLTAGNGYLLAATLSVAALVAYTMVRVQFAVSSAAMTVYAVLLATTLGEPAIEAVDQRALATALGIAIAAVSFLLWANPPLGVASNAWPRGERQPGRRRGR
jgi:Fusaric acid resistance protein-like